MKYDDWYDEDLQDELLEQLYDKFMAESYNICVAYDWYFPEEVLGWFEELVRFYVLLGEHPLSAEGKVVRMHNLAQHPWYFYHMDGGAKRWNRDRS